MRAMSSGRIPERKDVTAEIERWKKESAEKKLKMQQESAKKRLEAEAAQTSVAS